MFLFKLLLHDVWIIKKVSDSNITLSLNEWLKFIVNINKIIFIVPEKKSSDETHVDFVPTIFPHRSSIGSPEIVLSRCARRQKRITQQNLFPKST